MPKDGVPKDVAVELDVGVPNPKPAGFCRPKPVEVEGCGSPKPNEPACFCWAAPNAVVAVWATPKPKNKF